ncbi:MAG: hypothetical protein HUK22_08885 [Thermoguttaceae bacterium]|nr:hypothetical protein [Thermoguttaceae bacterium]
MFSLNRARFGAFPIIFAFFTILCAFSARAFAEDGYVENVVQDAEETRDAIAAKILEYGKEFNLRGDSSKNNELTKLAKELKEILESPKDYKVGDPELKLLDFVFARGAAFNDDGVKTDSNMLDRFLTDYLRCADDAQILLGLCKKYDDLVDKIEKAKRASRKSELEELDAAARDARDEMEAINETSYIRTLKTDGDVNMEIDDIYAEFKATAAITSPQDDKFDAETAFNVDAREGDLGVLSWEKTLANLESKLCDKLLTGDVAYVKNTIANVLGDVKKATRRASFARFGLTAPKPLMTIALGVAAIFALFATLSNLFTTCDLKSREGAVSVSASRELGAALASGKFLFWTLFGFLTCILALGVAGARWPVVLGLLIGLMITAWIVRSVKK